MAKKWITDLAMTVLLLLLMAYSLVGEVLHEWMGITMLVLFLLHHIWNIGLGVGLALPQVKFYIQVRVIALQVGHRHI